MYTVPGGLGEIFVPVPRSKETPSTQPDGGEH